MKAIILSFLFIGCCSSFYLSENNADHFSENNTEELVEIAPDFFVEKSLVDSYKTKKIHEVFRKLKAAKGDYRSRKPVLHLVETTGKGIAVAYQWTDVIKLEEKGFDICEEFGDKSQDVLAALLAHELIHIYEKHSWESNFAWEFGKTSLKKAISNEKKKDEIQADYLGGVLAYQAGFKVFGLMSGFNEKVYKEYNLDEDLEGYASRKQRDSIAVVSEEKFSHFINLFEMANLLASKGEYDDALIYYDQVLHEFQSRELYNNIGVVSLLAALRHFSKKQNPFAYPVELDIVSRMGQGKGDVDLEYRERKLLDAIHYFEKAIHLDPNYPIALLNKGCANALLGVARPATSALEWKDASVSAERAILMSEKKPGRASTLSDSHVLLGILAALNKDTAAAIRQFDGALAVNKDNLLAVANKSALGVGQSPFSGTGDLNGLDEKIDGTDIGSMNFGQEQLMFECGVSETDSLALWRMDLPHSHIIINEQRRVKDGVPSSTYHIFHQTEEGYTGETTKGISLKNGHFDLIVKEEKYGKPHEAFPLGNGTLLHYEYKNNDLFFHLGPDGKLLRWTIYKLIE